MILPFLEGIIGFFKAPITWALIIVNTIICFYTTSIQNKTRAQIDSFYEQDSLVRAQGEIFAEFISQNPEKYDSLFIKMSDLALQGNQIQKDTLGKIALRDRTFASESPNMTTEGDEVQLNYWKQEYEGIRSTLDRDPVNIWGLGMNDTGFSRWFSYQFLHGGFLHLLSNMWFLLIFGCYLEPIIGSLAFLIVYLLSGFFAAGTFIELSGISGVPLVGASGAVSGLMGIIVAMKWSEKVRFMYWILPIRGYTGFVMLPAWMLLVVWGVSDLAGYLSTVRELGGIAHAAHIGGALHGLLIGLFFRLWSKSTSHSIFSHNSRL